jgi:hypothetical protein
MRASLYRPGVVLPELVSCCPRNKGFGDKIWLDLNLPEINQDWWSDREPGRSDRQPRVAPGWPKSVINSGHLQVWKQDVKMKLLGPTSNLTWLHVGVRKYKSGTDVLRIWLRVKYKVMEDIVSFLTVNCTPQYGKRFRSYDFLKFTRQLKFRSGQNRVSQKIWDFDSKSNAIPGNFWYQHCS